MNTGVLILSLLLLGVNLVAGSQYPATWIEGPNGQLPSLAFPAQIQDSKGNMWLIGGASYDWDSAAYSHVWKLDVRNNYTWSAIQNWPINDTGKFPPKRGMEGSEFRPSARFDSLLWIDRDDNIWMYSGTTRAWTAYFADFWMFNTTSLNWKLIHESMPAEWGTKGTGVYNVTFPGDNSGAVTWTDFESNELWFLAGSNFKWRSDIWKYNIDSGVWTWMAGPKENDIPRSGDIEKMVWYSANEINIFPAWSAAFTPDPSGDIWFHGGNIPDFFISDELWRFRPSTLQLMWIAGEGTSKNFSVEGGVIQPASALTGAMSYIGNGIILYWPGYVNQENSFCDQLFTFNTTSMEWKFISGSTNETDLQPSYGKFRQADVSNYPGTRGEFRSQSVGALWVVRGRSGWYNDWPNRDTFVFSVDVCQTDVNPCDANAKCTASTGYVDCACNAGYEGDGWTCQALKSPTAETNEAVGGMASEAIVGLVSLISIL
jgi:hypothetical protein